MADIDWLAQVLTRRIFAKECDFQQGLHYGLSEELVPGANRLLLRATSLLLRRIQELYLSVLVDLIIFI